MRSKNHKYPSEVESPMPSLPPLALVVSLAVSSAALAADHQPPAAARATLDAERHLSLNLPSQAGGLETAGSALETPLADPPQQSPEAAPGAERRRHLLDLHLGRASALGHSPGDAPPLYGEVGIDLDSQSGLSLVPSYRVVVDEGDSTDSRTIGAQVLKLGARIRF